MAHFLNDYLETVLGNTKTIKQANDNIYEATLMAIGYCKCMEDNNLNNGDLSSLENLGNQNVCQLKDTIKEIEDMLIELKIKGSIRERGNGLIEFRNSQFGSVYGRNVEELRQKLEKKIRYLKAHIKKPEKKKKSPLMSEYFTQVYLPYKETQSRAKSTLKGINYNFKFLMESGFDKPIADYTAKEIETFLFSMKQTRKAQIIQGLLNNIFNKAVTDGVLQSNPCTTIDKVEHDTDDGKALSFEEQEKFFKKLFADDSIKLEDKSYFVFVYLTGTRRDEARNIQAKDIDFKKSVIHIPGTKTDGSNRYMPLFPLAEKVLRCLKIESNPFRITHSNIYKIFNNIIDSYKLHDLRHSFGTIQICVEKINPKTVSLWMGHTNTQTTMDIYTHPEQLDRALFLRGDIENTEKTVLLREKYQKILAMISAYYDNIPQNVPKK